MRKFDANISELEIVSCLRKRDKGGASMLYRQYANLLYGIIFRIVQRQDLAENVMQDTFLKVWQNIDSYDESKGRFISWVANIARNAAIDTVRSKAFRKDQKTGGIEFAGQVPTEMSVDHIGIRDVVGKLESKYQQLISLLYFEGYTQSEVAEELDIPLGTVKSRVRKAFSDLRVLLG